MTDSGKPNLDEAAIAFLASLPAEEKADSQQEVYKFIRWYGREKRFDDVIPAAVADYAEQLSASDADYKAKLALVHDFLVYVFKKKWAKTNLSVHLKVKQAKPSKNAKKVKPVARRNAREQVSLTAEGFESLKAELEVLKTKRVHAIEEMQKAAADKDFRENAPLDAAREQRSHIEGQIKEIEEILKSAVSIDVQVEATFRVKFGDVVTVVELETGEQVCYTIVNTREVNPAKGKISAASPIGKAIYGKNQGETCEVIAPSGKLKYRIERIGR